MCVLFWGAHKSLAPRARTLLGVLGQATLSFFAVATLLFFFSVSVLDFATSPNSGVKLFGGVSGVGRDDFLLYFFWLCVFFLVFIFFCCVRASSWKMIKHRGLNEQTQHDSYSLPLMDTILQKQAQKRIFTVLDLKHGYHQMPLHEDSRACTAMSTPLGPMQSKVVPMGAKNGNAVFQRIMEDLLGPVRDCADPFVDDIIIGSGPEDMSRMK